jgi:hypothetical protein
MLNPKFLGLPIRQTLSTRIFAGIHPKRYFSELTEITGARDYYEMFGVKPDADIKEIKKAFRNLGTTYFP